MGICKSNPQTEGSQLDISKPEEIKNEVINNEVIENEVNKNEVIKNEEIKPKEIENDAALKIQSSIRGKKAKQEFEKKKEELEQDKPKDWTEYKGKFIEPSLPTQFKDKVNYKPTNEDRFFPPYQSTDGNIYNGQWNKGEMNGYGQMLRPDGTYLKGLWKYNVFSEGGILYPNGDYFIGTTKYGQRVYANGLMYKGETDYGIPHGKGEETHPDGKINQASYQYGQKVQQDNSHQNH